MSGPKLADELYSAAKNLHPNNDMDFVVAREIF